MNLVFLGMPNSGKGTYAELMTNALNIPHIPTRKLLNDEVASGSAMGQKINELMASGELVDDSIMLSLLKQRLQMQDCQNGFILDGFPRTITQADDLAKIVPVHKVLHFKADDEVLIQRSAGRTVCEPCNVVFHKTGKREKVENHCDYCSRKLTQREDDRPDVFKKRIEIYREKTNPLINHYAGQHLLTEVVINKSVDEIRERIIWSLKGYLDGSKNLVWEIK